MLDTTIERHAGRRLRVARLGSGPPLVLLHGYPDNLQIFSALAPCLADRFEVIAFDWPGMGQSDAWPGGTTPRHMADRLLTLLDAWGLGGVSLVGMDMGGQPALVLAAERSDRVRNLVVMNSFVFWELTTSWDIRLLRRYRWNERILGSLPSIVFRRAERTFLPRGVRLPADLRSDLWQSFRRPEVRGFISRMCGGYQADLPRLPELYGRIRSPTLVLWAGRDRHFPVAQAEALHAAIPGSRLEVIPEAEHWMVWQQPAEVAAHIRSLCAAVAGEDPTRA
jgi:pimeloyl-ACP methyl ester carboxylesterase